MTLAMPTLHRLVNFEGEFQAIQEHTVSIQHVASQENVRFGRPKDSTHKSGRKSWMRLPPNTTAVR